MDMPLLDGYQVSKGEYPYSEVYVCCAVLSMEKSTILYSLVISHTAFTNKVLTDSPLWIRRIVSAIKGAIESMVIFGSRFSGGMGTVLVVTISTISRCSRSR